MTGTFFVDLLSPAKKLEMSAGRWLVLIAFCWADHTSILSLIDCAILEARTTITILMRSMLQDLLTYFRFDLIFCGLSTYTKHTHTNHKSHVAEWLNGAQSSKQPRV